MSGAVAAVDLGATSGRVIVGRLADGRVDLTTVHRFPNTPVATPDGLHWNIFELYRNVLDGLAAAALTQDSFQTNTDCTINYRTGGGAARVNPCRRESFC